MVIIAYGAIGLSVFSAGMCIRACMAANHVDNLMEKLSGYRSVFGRIGLFGSLLVGFYCGYTTGKQTLSHPAIWTRCSGSNGSLMFSPNDIRRMLSVWAFCNVKLRRRTGIQIEDHDRYCAAKTKCKSILVLFFGDSQSFP